MGWFYLIIAGLLEIGWPLGLKLAWSKAGFRIVPAVAAVVLMMASGAFLFLAQRTIPMGTAYAVWTGIGAVGAFVVGILLFHEPAHPARWLSVALIVMGIVGLKFSSGP